VNATDWNKAKEIFNSAFELSTDARTAYLLEACGDDAQLREEVEKLLGLYDSTFMEWDGNGTSSGLPVTARKVIGRYQVDRLLGTGGMGEVYLAHDSQLDRKVAIKLLNKRFADNESNVQRFIREARAASALNHPNILTIHEIGRAEDSHYIVSEFIDGHTLRTLLGSGSVDLPRVLDVSTQIAAALSTAHAARIIHRDIKPENVVVRNDGYVKVVDFGLAKLLPEQRSPAGLDDETVRQNHTAKGLILGTINYMSPEQAKGEAVDARTDIFSLGVVIYEMVTGRTPFAANSTSEAFANLINRDPEPMSRYTHDVPEELQRIVSKMLRKDPDERYQTAKGLLADLRELKERITLENNVARSTLNPRDKSSEVLKVTSDDVTRSTIVAESYYSARRKTIRNISLAAVVLILTAVGLTYVYTAREPAIKSIAVLPFVNANADPEIDFLADGITDNIIQRLSQIAALKVTAHTAVFRYKGKDIDPQAIANELGVEAILTGRFVKRNDALTVSLELVNARDNSHLWGQQYDRAFSDLLELQREIPFDVSENLRLRLSGESKERLTRSYTNDSEAYQLYLKGRYFLDQWETEKSKRAIEFFEEAIRKDPEYALAYAGLAEAYIWGPRVGLSQSETHRRAKEAATKAISIDPQLAEAYGAIAKVTLFENWDFAGAERALLKAIQLNPSYAEGHHTYSHLLLNLGRWDESLIESKKLLELDPISETSIGHLAYHYLYSRQYDLAIQQYEIDRQRYPDSNQANHVQLAQAYYQKGMIGAAIDEYIKGFAAEGLSDDKIAALRAAAAKSGISGFYQELIEQEKTKPVTEQDKVWFAELYARLDQKDKSFEWLEKAYAEHDDALVRLKEELGFDNLRSDSRYADLLRRIGLPQ
jgi:serine/threonine protein kinase/predicted Zn-dependent protease